MTPAPDFRLYHGNALDVLAGLLAEALRTDVPGQSVLAPDTILIPQVAMRRWLQASLAARHGIAANLEFLTPGEFVARALDTNLGTSKDDLDLDSLHWRLHAALSDPALRRKPAMAQAEAATPCQWATRLAARSPVNRMTLRRLSTGTMSVTPNSTAFWMVKSIFSPACTAWISVTTSFDSRSISRQAPKTTTTRVFSIRSMCA